jgi:hypothetical protein
MNLQSVAVLILVLGTNFSCSSAPTCDDGLHNGEETALDCGGSCGPCGDLAACGVSEDCLSGVCLEGECQLPTCVDLVQNGEETDLDCGGRDCSPCENDLSCLVETDCISEICAEEVCEAVCPEGAVIALLDGIYYDMLSRNAERAERAEKLDQGAKIRAFNEANGNDVLPYCYNGAADWNADRVYTEDDFASFENWLNENIPEDYEGPLVLDMEGQWWHDMETVSSQQEMDVIVDFYLEGLEVAQSLRPKAKIGYWGLPKKHRTKEDYVGPTMERLLLAQGAIFPDTYENNPGGDDSERLTRHVRDTIRIVGGKIPVYPQMSPRYKQSGMVSYCGFHENDEVMRDQANAILDAAWEAPDGTTCRAAGLALWDAYVYAKNCYEGDWNILTDDEVSAMWDELDEWHLSLYEEFTSLVESAQN